MNKDQMPHFSSMVEAINYLEKNGYTYDLKLDADCITYHGGKSKLMPDEFKIDYFFRFEGMTDPDDQSILYAISSEKHDVKGILVNGFGLSSDPLTDIMVRKLSTNE